MAMNDLEAMAQVFERGNNEIYVDPYIAEQAMIPLRRMLDFASELQVTVKGNA
jgi:quinolinate synthase